MSGVKRWLAAALGLGLVAGACSSSGQPEEAVVTLSSAPPSSLASAVPGSNSPDTTIDCPVKVSPPEYSSVFEVRLPDGRIGANPGNNGWVVDVKRKGEAPPELTVSVRVKHGVVLESLAFMIGSTHGGDVWSFPAGSQLEEGKHEFSFGWDGSDEDGVVMPGRFQLSAETKVASDDRNPCSSLSGGERFGLGYFLVDFAPPALVDMYGCGFGFHVGSQDQTVGLFVSLTERGGEIPSISVLPDSLWEAEMRLGENLFADWCDDVIGGPPRPAVVQVWPIVAGTIEITELLAGSRCPAQVRARLTGLRASRQGQEVTLPDIDVENLAWGCVAG